MGSGKLLDPTSPYFPSFPLISRFDNSRGKAPSSLSSFPILPTFVLLLFPPLSYTFLSLNTSSLLLYGKNLLKYYYSVNLPPASCFQCRVAPSLSQLPPHRSNQSELNSLHLPLHFLLNFGASPSSSRPLKSPNPILNPSPKTSNFLSRPPSGIAQTNLRHLFRQPSQLDILVSGTSLASLSGLLFPNPFLHLGQGLHKLDDSLCQSPHCLVSNLQFFLILFFTFFSSLLRLFSSSSPSSAFFR